MKINEMKKTYVHWDLVRFITEDKIENSCMALAEYGSDTIYDLMVYLFKNDNKWLVLVYKSEEADDFDSFDFDSFDDAHEFVETLSWKHPEYKTRPFKKINRIKE